MKHRNPITRWLQQVVMSTESVTAHGMQRELEAIADRREWESPRSASANRAA